MAASAYLRALRPEQWVKNAFVFVALVFAGRLSDLHADLLSLAAFVIFCAQAGAVYLFNDVLDREDDRGHPLKRARPVAAGLVPPAGALTLSAALTAAALGAAVAIDRSFALAVGGYAALNVCYSLALKRVIILDAIAVAAGFVLRTLAGCYVIDVMVTDWLIVSAMCISLLIAFGKRRQELVLHTAASGEPPRSRPPYTVGFLDITLAVMAASTVVVYMLYTKDPAIERKFGTDKLIWTNPFVVFGVLRYLYLVHGKTLGAAPTRDVTGDLPLVVTVLAWGAAATAVIYGWPAR